MTGTQAGARSRQPAPTDQPTRRQRTAEQRADDSKRIVDLYQKDRLSIQKIVEIVGLSHGTVHSTLVDAGVQRRSRGGVHPRLNKTTGGDR